MSKSKTRHYSLRSFFSFARPYRWKVLLVTVSFAVADILIAIIPFFIGRLVGALAANPIKGHQAVLYTWVLIICSTGHNIVWRLSEVLYMKYLNPVSFEYETFLFKRVIQKPYPYFVDKFTGKLSSYINTIRQEVAEFLQNACYNYTNELVSLIIVTIIMSSINWQTGTIFITSVLVMLLVGRHTIKNSTKYEKISADTQSTKNGKLIDAIANFVNVKSFQKEAAETETIAKEQATTIKAANRSYVWSIFFWGSMSFFIRDVIWPLTIGLNVYLFLHHELSITQLATLLSTILIFSSTIWEAIWYISQFNLKLARLEEAHSYLFGRTNIVTDKLVETPPITKLAELRKELELRKLHFAYPDKSDIAVLTNIDLSLKKGEKLGIVGKSGSGKSTLTKLLLGYYPADDNQIFLDGQPIKTQDLATLISYVPQDTSLFHRSIAENIAYATDEQVDRAAIVQAAEQAHADEFIKQIDQGYEALVGERGVKLSAGQRQRIAIARAFLDNKPILILDEATSALDSESEVLVQQGLEALWQNKTVIAIAHRLSTLRHMDRILVMDKGKIIEQGTHQELLRKNGVYAKLWDHQSGGFIDE